MRKNTNRSGTGVPPVPLPMCCRHLAGRTNKKTSNNEHRTLNAEGARVEKPSAFVVQRSMFDVSQAAPGRRDARPTLTNGNGSSGTGVPPVPLPTCCRHLAGRTNKKTSNIEHRTLNAEGARVEKPSAFDVQCSMFDVSQVTPGRRDACPTLANGNGSGTGVPPVQFTVGQASRLPSEKHRTRNIEHRTPKGHRAGEPSMFGVQRSMFDVSQAALGRRDAYPTMTL